MLAYMQVLRLHSCERVFDVLTNSTVTECGPTEGPGL